MKGRKKGTAVGKYLKYCFISKNHEGSKNQTRIEANEFAYPFASEYKSCTAFLNDYQSNADLYVFLKEDGTVPKNECIPSVVSKRKQNNNYKSFCRRCEELEPQFYSTCEYRKYVSQEHEIRLFIRDIAKDGTFYCSKCGKWFYAHGYKKSSSTISLQDIRLRSRPACLEVRRERMKCPQCGILMGDQQAVGFQAYCDGKMTCRLAENVLYAQLSSVKREYIAEAYGISTSQVDRIKKRMIHQSLEARRYRMKLVIESFSDLPVIIKVFKDKNTGHVYYLYFLMRSASEAVLIHILTQADRDALALLGRDLETFRKHFPDADAFYLACYCCLAGERGLKGSELINQLDQFEQLYMEGFSEFGTEKKTKDLFFTDPIRKEKTSALLRLLRRERTSETVEPKLMEEDGQYILPEYAELFSDAQSADEWENREVDAFLSLLQSVLLEHKTPSRIVKESLLLFNPALITKLEVDYLTGKRHPDLDAEAFRLEGAYMLRPPFGVPQQCLTHFLKNGLFDPETDKLFPCALMEEIRYTEDGDRILPCGLRGAFCPHLESV